MKIMKVRVWPISENKAWVIELKDDTGEYVAQFWSEIEPEVVKEQPRKVTGK